jgi:hypothetical protein
MYAQTRELLFKRTMSNIIDIYDSLQAFLRARYDGSFDNYIFKTLNFYEYGSQSGIVVGEVSFVDNQVQGNREIRVWQAFPVLSQVNQRPDLEGAKRICLSLAENMALSIKEWYRVCSAVGAKGVKSVTASAQILPLENVRSIIKQTDTVAQTSPTINPTSKQPLTASFYAIAVCKFELDYFAEEP